MRGGTLTFETRLEGWERPAHSQGVDAWDPHIAERWEEPLAAEEQFHFADKGLWVWPTARLQLREHRAGVDTLTAQNHLECPQPWMHNFT